MTRTNQAVWLEKQERWQIKIQVDGVRRTFTSATPGRTGKAECNAKADKWLRERTVGESTPVSDLWSLWEKSITSEEERRKANSLWRTWAKDRIGTKKISRLTEGDLQAVLDDMSALAKKTQMTARSRFTAFVKWCRINKYTTLFPESLHIAKNARSKGKDILTPEDIKRVFECDGRYVNLYRLALLTGMRPGELIGLQWGDISGSKVHIRRSVNSINEITKGKNENAQRCIVLPPRAMEVLSSQKQLINKNAVITSWVFPLKETHTSLSSVAKQWTKFKATNGLTDTPLYGLRHTWVSYMDNMPEGLKKRIVGHSNNMDTEGIYGHSLQSDWTKAADYITLTMDEILK